MDNFIHNLNLWFKSTQHNFLSLALNTKVSTGNLLNLNS